MDNDRKDVYISIRVTQKEYELLLKKAEEANCYYGGKPCISKYIRKVGLDNTELIIADLKPVLYQLKKIGTNINQIAKLANMGKIQTLYFNDVQKGFKEITNQLAKLSEKDKGK